MYKNLILKSKFGQNTKSQFKSQFKVSRNKNRCESGARQWNTQNSFLQFLRQKSKFTKKSSKLFKKFHQNFDIENFFSKTLAQTAAQTAAEVWAILGVA